MITATDRQREALGVGRDCPARQREQQLTVAIKASAPCHGGSSERSAELSRQTALDWRRRLLSPRRRRQRSIDFEGGQSRRPQ